MIVEFHERVKGRTRSFSVQFDIREALKCPELDDASPKQSECTTVTGIHQRLFAPSLHEKHPCIRPAERIEKFWV